MHLTSSTVSVISNKSGPGLPNPQVEIFFQKPGSQKKPVFIVETQSSCNKISSHSVNSGLPRALKQKTIELELPLTSEDSYTMSEYVVDQGLEVAAAKPKSQKKTKIEEPTDPPLEQAQ